MSEPNVLSMPWDLLQTRGGKWMIRKKADICQPRRRGSRRHPGPLQVTNGGPLRLCHCPTTPTPGSPAP